MTNDQIKLLLDLKASKERGAASMSCGTRTKIAHELVKLKLVDSTSFMSGTISGFYYITDKGLKILKGIHR